VPGIVRDRRYVSGVRAARLVQLLLLLQTRGQVSAPELARELEVSVRTVYRDLEALSAAGVPVYSEPGRHGGARLVDGYRTRLTGLTTDEADAVLLTGLPDAAAELGLGTVLAAAQLKVLAALPPELRSRATRVRERFHLDAPGWFRRTEELPHLETVADALWADRSLVVRYDRRGEVVERRLDPLGLVLKAGTWYLVARHGSDIRTYRVSRIVDAVCLEDTFERPEAFDLGGHWSESSGAFERAMQTVRVVALVEPESVMWLRSVLDPSSWEELESELPAAMAAPAPDGRVVVAFGMEQLEMAVSELLRMGARLEVLEPPELRRAIAATARAMVQRYAG
jgi:predicted DNA-binding transcriptional regulator YafY